MCFVVVVVVVAAVVCPECPKLHKNLSCKVLRSETLHASFIYGETHHCSTTGVRFIRWNEGAELCTHNRTVSEGVYCFVVVDDVVEYWLINEKKKKKVYACAVRFWTKGVTMAPSAKWVVTSSEDTTSCATSSIMLANKGA